LLAAAGCRRFHSPAEKDEMIALQPLVALIFGILILIMPRLLNYLIAIYLIIIGLSGLSPNLFATAPWIALFSS
jgi:hypothetical protein